MGERLTWLFCLALASPAGIAQAQPASAPRAPGAAPPTTASSKPRTVDEVTVTAPSQDFRSAIDRRSYSVAKDLQSTTGSVADVLRNVPSVEVDLQGNVTLRGDPNVTIMVDGKPSGLFRGESRAAALQQMGADQIERVEVIANPSAAFNPEGSAGIINLITKTARKPGYSGSARASLGGRGRYNTGLSGAYNSSRLTVSGDLGARGGDPQRFRSAEFRRQVTPQGVVTSHDATLLNGLGRIWNARGGVDYDLDRKTRLSAELRHLDVVADQQGPEHFQGVDSLGAVVKAFDRDIGPAHFRIHDTEASGTWRRQFAGDDHDLTVNLRREWSEYDFTRPDRLSVIQPPQASVSEAFRLDETFRVTGLKADYQRPLPGEARLKAGYELQIDRNLYDGVMARGGAPDALVVDPGQTSLFLYRQAINSAYATYERPFGDLTALAGLRLERVHLDLDQFATGSRDASSYVRAYPSLHLSYPLSETQKLTASFSRRVQRPRPNELDPFRVYRDPLSYWQGNPRLRPQETDALEAGYEFKRGATYRLATLFYRQTHDAIVDVTEDLGGGVLLTTRQNLGESRSGGLELAANGKLTAKLSYNLSGGASWNEIDAANLGFSERRSGFSLSGRGNLNWQATPRELLQANFWLTGKRLTPQGYRAAVGVLNLGYRRQLSSALFAVVTVQDVLGSFKDQTVLDTPVLSYRRAFRGNGTTVFVGLTYTFGGAGAKPREPAFDFGGTPAP